MANLLDMSLDDIISTKNVGSASQQNYPRSPFRKGGAMPMRSNKNDWETPKDAYIQKNRNGFRSKPRRFLRRGDFDSKPFSNSQMGYRNEMKPNERRWIFNKQPRNHIVKISNLEYSILQEDLMELFSSIGEVIKVWVDYDRTDRSEGTGGCVFRNAEDAQRAIEKYDGCRIEGLAIKLELLPRGEKTAKVNSSVRPMGN